jgi:hypothetical protein
MSNNSPTSNPTKKSTETSPSKKNSTPDDTAAFDPALAMQVLLKTAEELEERREEMKSLTDFTAALKTAKEDDLRLYWDVRLIKGESTPYSSVQGSSSIPGALTDKMLAHAPVMIQQEVMDKIAQPLTSVFMRAGEVANFIDTQRSDAKRRKSKTFDVDVVDSAQGGESVTRIAEEMEYSGDDVEREPTDE